MEIAVATLATDRALLLLGVPGTAKTWVSEHLAAAISGDSTLLVQGTAGTTEETLRYGWNYARLLAEGPSEAALVPSPVYRAMQAGSLVRIEELTRMPTDVQDALVTMLSEKTLPVPELATEVHGGARLQPHRHRQRPRPRRQRAVARAAPPLQHRACCRCPRRPRRRWRSSPSASPSSARRWRCPPSRPRPTRSAASSPCSASCASGVTDDGRTSLKIPTGTLSTAEAISVVTNGLSLAAHFGDGALSSDDVAAGIVGAVVRDPVHDAVAWREYLEGVVADRDGWADFYDACRALELTGGAR